MGTRMSRSTGWVVPCPWITGPEDVAGSCLLGYPFSESPPPSTTALGQLLPRAKSCRCPVWDPVSHLVVSLLGIIPQPISPPCEINVLAIPQCIRQPHLPFGFHVGVLLLLLFCNCGSHPTQALYRQTTYPQHLGFILPIPSDRRRISETWSVSLA